MLVGARWDTKGAPAFRWRWVLSAKRARDESDSRQLEEEGVCIGGGLGEPQAGGQGESARHQGGEQGKVGQADLGRPKRDPDIE